VLSLDMWRAGRGDDALELQLLPSPFLRPR